MYLKPLSTASVTTTSPALSSSASRSAPTTFAPDDVPAKTPSSAASRREASQPDERRVADRVENGRHRA
jgi:hypothetical protein